MMMIMITKTITVLAKIIYLNNYMFMHDDNEEEDDDDDNA